MESSPILSLALRPFPALVKEEGSGGACAVSGCGMPPAAAAPMTTTSRDEARASALRELAEGLTAVTDYLAAALHVSEAVGADKADEARLTDILRKALTEANRADKAMISLRNLLSEEQK